MEQILLNLHTEINKYIENISQKIPIINNEFLNELSIDDIFNHSSLVERIGEKNENLFFEHHYKIKELYRKTKTSKIDTYHPEKVMKNSFHEIIEKILPENIKIYYDTVNVTKNINEDNNRLIYYTNHDLIINLGYSRNQYNSYNVNVMFYSNIFDNFKIYFTIRDNTIVFDNGETELSVKEKLKQCIKYINPYIYLDYISSLDEKTLLKFINKLDHKILIDRDEYIIELLDKINNNKKQEEETTNLIIKLDKKINILKNNIIEKEKIIAIEKIKKCLQIEKFKKNIISEKNKEIDNIKKQHIEDMDILKSKNERLLNELNDKNLQNKKLSVKLNDINELYDKLQEKYM